MMRYLQYLILLLCQKLVTEKITAENFLNTLYPLIMAAKSQKLTLNFSMSIVYHKLL